MRGRINDRNTIPDLESKCESADAGDSYLSVFGSAVFLNGLATSTNQVKTRYKFLGQLVTIGCAQCKKRRVKCDFTKPECTNCVKRRCRCPGYQKPLRWVYGRQREKPETVEDSLPNPELPVVQAEPIFDAEVIQLLYNPIPPLFNLPFNADAHLLDIYFRRTCKTMSMSEYVNPYRTAVIPMIHRSLPLLHVVQSMAAFQIGQIGQGILNRRSAVDALRGDSIAAVERVCTEETVLTMMLLGLTSSWYRDIACTSNELLAARALMKEYNEQVREMTPFVVNAYRYWECVCAFSADTDEPPPNFPVSPSNDLDPLVGVGTDLFPVLSLLGWSVRHHCSSHCRSEMLSDTHHDLFIRGIEQVLLSWKSPDSPLIHFLGPEAVSAAESYRLAGLISLYRTHPYLGGDVQSIARACLNSLRMAPDDGLTTASMPLLIAGCEQRGEADREFVVSKFQVLERTVGLRVISRIKELVQDVWQREDQGENPFWLDVMTEKGWALVLG